MEFIATVVGIIAVLLAILIIFMCCKFLYKLKYNEHERNMMRHQGLMFNNCNYSSHLLISPSSSNFGSYTQNTTIPRCFLTSDTLQNSDSVSINLQALDSVSINTLPVTQQMSEMLPPPLPSLSSMPALSKSTLGRQSLESVYEETTDDPTYSVIDKMTKSNLPVGEEEETLSAERKSEMTLEDEIMGILNSKKDDDINEGNSKEYDSIENNENDVTERNDGRKKKDVIANKLDDSNEKSGKQDEQYFEEATKKDEKKMVDMNNIDKLFNDSAYEELKLQHES
ncbi:uncharacterized protein [Antedon mediterranea]|uniref:uncharacterized protein n=1 Tax=Antedon mediterranea TaxID=105859 RepID=UPI003AF6C9C5